MGKIALYGRRGHQQDVLGIIGCGNIGGIVADRAKGLHMRVIAYDPFLSQERADQLGVEKVELDELLPSVLISFRCIRLSPIRRATYLERGCNQQNQTGRSHC